MEFVKDGVGGVDGIDGAISVTISPDEKHIYVASAGDDAVAVFSRSIPNTTSTLVPSVSSWALAILAALLLFTFSSRMRGRIMRRSAS